MESSSQRPFSRPHPGGSRAGGADPAPTERPGIFLSLGSNLGHRRGHLEAGLADLAARGARPVACSAVYRTEPVGGPAQPDFLNIAVEVATALEPRRLLEAALAAERQRGRQRDGERCGPRTLDVDLLLYRDAVIREPGLRLPHPRCHLRRFVLVPLADLAAERIHPEMGLSVADLLARCPDGSAVERVESPLSLPPAAPEGRVESPETFG